MRDKAVKPIALMQSNVILSPCREFSLPLHRRSRAQNSVAIGCVDVKR